MLYLLFIGRLLLIDKLLGRIDEYFARYIVAVLILMMLFGVSMDKAGFGINYMTWQVLRSVCPIFRAAHSIAGKTRNHALGVPIKPCQFPIPSVVIAVLTLMPRAAKNASNKNGLKQKSTRAIIPAFDFGY